MKQVILGSLLFIAANALVTVGCRHVPASSDVASADVDSRRLTSEDELPLLMRPDGGIMQLWNQSNDKFLSVNRYYGTGDDRTKVNLNYKEFINPNSTRAIVILHGFGEYIGKYRELIYDFYRSGYSVYIYSHRGFGRSERLLKDLPFRVYTDKFEYYANDLHTIIQQVVKPNRYAKIFLFGHSMGGAIAAVYLKDFPGETDAAVLSSPMIEALTPKPYTEAQIFGVTSQAIQAGASVDYLPGQADPDPTLDTFENAAGSSRARYDEYVQWRAHQDQDTNRPFAMWGATNGFINTAISSTTQLRQPERVKHITTPVLLGVARIDTLVSAQTAMEFCGYLQRCKALEYNDKHDLWFDSDATRSDFIGKSLKFFDSN